MKTCEFCGKPVTDKYSNMCDECTRAEDTTPELTYSSAASYTEGEEYIDRREWEEAVRGQSDRIR
jgi:NMD protein affecting ribosome stability and mRNA decay